MALRGPLSAGAAPLTITGGGFLLPIGGHKGSGLAIVIGLLAGVAATSLYAPTASAHGEKSQAAFMRMRTIHWFDLTWSKEKVNVNDFVEIKGKFHVFEGWPESVAEPDVSFLNIGFYVVFNHLTCLTFRCDIAHARRVVLTLSPVFPRRDV